MAATTGYLTGRSHSEQTGKGLKPSSRVAKAISEDGVNGRLSTKAPVSKESRSRSSSRCRCTPHRRTRVYPSQAYGLLADIGFGCWSPSYSSSLDSAPSSSIHLRHLSPACSLASTILSLSNSLLASLATLCFRVHHSFIHTSRPSSRLSNSPKARSIPLQPCPTT